MAKKTVKLKVKLESTAGTGTFYLVEKNPKTHPEKMSLKKYDKKTRKHEEFVEKKLK
ncbi:MAG: 50S ribosomal protein L33 [Alphaproteobacteria bacterium]|nr:50S ribosomal protein L33 [Alphaproteobacteria bacterium]